ncbi:unnamed protein product [Paramecium sonneborni]|uniref:Uncharacterized protein n=1 Tax=Paramecium sonneborni TaxID=65129 RepID=A0A8S1RN83_9CILI|nr:unnamed protein product [Paramecium sonneborni]
MNKCDFLYQQCAVIKVYYKQVLERIQFLMMAQTSKQLQIFQINSIILTKLLINVTDKTTIIKSKSIDYQQTLPLKFFTKGK